MVFKKKNELFQWAKDLFPIHRSLTGNGNRKTLLYIKKKINNLKIIEVPSGKKVYDWKIPDEWNVTNAYIKNNKGEKILDIKDNNLHIVSYSKPIKKKVNLKELKKHLYTIKKLPDAIPYVTSYYKKKWGFCIKYNNYKKLKSGIYKVYIDSKFNKNGFLTYGEYYFPGKSKKEILFSTNICHPSMANNELSGIIVAMAISKFLKKLKRNYSYRILFIPETIGAINFIHDNYSNLKKNLKAGFVLACLGDNGKFSYVPSPKGDTLADKIYLTVLKKYFKNFKKYNWLNRGSDERQFCSPLIDLPVVCISKSKFAGYKEYHTSLDNLNFISKEGLEESFSMIKRCITSIENKKFYKTKIPCEAFLTKYNLIDTTNFFYKNNSKKKNNHIISDIISFCNGKNDISDISEECKIPEETVKKNIDILLKKKIIVKH